MLVFFVAMLFSAAVRAQERVKVVQDEALDLLVEKYRQYQQKVDVEEGYRIQITYTSNREEAYKAKSQLYRDFESAASYIEYEQPNYKLRLGDFKTRLEATAFLQQVIKIYPAAFIVKDRIKVK